MPLHGILFSPEVPMGQTMRDFLAIYIDLENVQKSIDLSRLMRDVVLKYETDSPNQEPVYAAKIACGNSTSITKLRDQLKELNFEIRETPHVTGKKNRSDLIISLDALEKLFLDRPSIDQFVFVTNDSDFTVIMDILRRYGKRVVLVASEEDSKRQIFNNCSDEIMVIEDYLMMEDGGPRRPRRQNRNQDEKQVKAANANRAAEVYRNDVADDAAIAMFLSILKLLDPDREYQSSVIGSKFKEMDKSFDMGHTSFPSSTSWWSTWPTRRS
jgi:uncharacterized LabA/DUF88 family protein